MGCFLAFYFGQCQSTVILLLWDLCSVRGLSGMSALIKGKYILDIGKLKVAKLLMGHFAPNKVVNFDWQHY